MILEVPSIFLINIETDELVEKALLFHFIRNSKDGKLFTLIFDCCLFTFEFDSSQFYTPSKQKQRCQYCWVSVPDGISAEKNMAKKQKLSRFQNVLWLAMVNFIRIYGQKRHHWWKLYPLKVKKPFAIDPLITLFSVIRDINENVARWR